MPTFWDGKQHSRILLYHEMSCCLTKNISFGALIFLTHCYNLLASPSFFHSWRQLHLLALVTRTVLRAEVLRAETSSQVRSRDDSQWRCPVQPSPVPGNSEISWGRDREVVRTIFWPGKDIGTNGTVIFMLTGTIHHAKLVACIEVDNSLAFEPKDFNLHLWGWKRWYLEGLKRQKWK